MKRLIILLFIFANCECKSQTETGLWEYSNTDNLDHSNFQYYLPAELFRREIYEETKIDSFLINSISASLKAMNESTFSNKFLGGENYRFTWLRSFHPPIVITIRHDGERLEIISKIANKVGLDESYTDVSQLSRDEYEFYLEYEQGKETDSLKFKSISSKVIYHKDTIKFKVRKKKETISNKKWEELKKALDKDHVLRQKSITPYEPMTDGAYWILEINLKSGYKIIFRHSPDENRFPEFRRVCDKIIDLSNLQNEDRY